MNELANRYATALYSLKLDSNKLVETQNEVKELKKIIKDNPDFIMILSSSYYDFKKKSEIIDITLVNVDEDIKNLLKIAVKNHRANLIVEIFEEFNSLVNEYRGIIEGLVYSSMPLKEDELTKLNKAISEVESRPTDLKNIIDPSLIGGVKVVINDHIYDGSIKHHIDEMKKALLHKED